MKYKVEVTKESTKWYNESNQPHREDGPAVEFACGYKAYYINGKPHREDGPAVEFAEGYKEYYINGKYLTKQEFNSINRARKTVIVDGITYKVEVTDYSTRWYNESNELHREDGPAMEWADGTKHYYINGQRHREDGPAMETADGEKHYYINGERHRENGPAVEYAYGGKSYYINGKCLTKKEFKACDGKTVIVDGITYKLVKI